MSFDHDDFDKLRDAAAEIIDNVTKQFADRDKYDDYLDSACESSDSPPDDGDGYINVSYTDTDDYDGDGEYEYCDGEYYKK